MTQPPPYIVSRSHWDHVRDTAYDLAILPWGATEAHNYHLPYGTDVYEAEGIAAESARLAWEQGVHAGVLPAIPFGVNTGQSDIKLTVNFNPSTNYIILRDVVESLLKQGINKLVVLNSHGGNDFRPHLRELGAKYPILLVQISWFQIMNKEEYFTHPGEHADEMETSLMMHLQPGLVRPLSEAGEGEENKFRVAGLRERWAWMERHWLSATNDTGIGKPHEATAEKGARFFEDVTRKISRFLVDFGKADPEDLYEKPPAG